MQTDADFALLGGCDLVGLSLNNQPMLPATKEMSDQTGTNSSSLAAAERGKPSYIQLGEWAQELLEFSNARTRTRDREPNPNAKARGCCGNGVGDSGGPEGGCALL